MDKCPCGSDLNYNECCEPIIKGEKIAESPEQVMRARYSAYVKREIDYLGETLLPSGHKDFDPKSTREWAESSDWQGLQIITTKDGGADDLEGEVEFIATFKQKGQVMKHHELATFKKYEGRWYFSEGKVPTPQQYVRTDPKIGRNDPCSCGSGKKFKKCCGVN